MKCSNKIYLSDLTFLDIIKINSIVANISLTTNVVINVDENSTEVSYRIKSWDSSASHKAIEKEFSNYNDAYSYFNEIIEKCHN